MDIAFSPITQDFRLYGKYYDIIYADKDYEKECDFLEEIFRRYLKSMPKTILDAGCGTGGHAIPLAKRGFRVTGVDASEVMISIAKEKARENRVDVDFYVMDLREIRLNEKFEACVCMFAVMDYLTENRDVQGTLSNVRKHLKDGSLFVFDFWYGPAVLTILPRERVKTMQKGNIRVIRVAKPHLDTFHHICEVNYQLIAIKGNTIVDEVKEKHVVRFFFLEEIKHYLQESGFRLLKLCPFLDIDGKPHKKVWNVTAVCRAI